MHEEELRQFFVDTCCSYHGCNEADGSHKTIINMYNSIQPLPIGYRVSHTDAWCAAYVSAMAWKSKLTDIIFPECGCDRMIALYKKAGRWQENDGYIPKPGDICFYDWEDSGIGDNTGSSDHVGVVVLVSGNSIKVIEGNISNRVDYRDIAVNGKFIRGYGLPDFAKKAGGTSVFVPDVDVPEADVEDIGGECEVKLPVLRRGSKGKSVKALQLLLEGNDCRCGSYGADGDFGAATHSAVLLFQRRNNLVVDGIVGPATWAALLK